MKQNSENSRETNPRGKVDALKLRKIYLNIHIFNWAVFNPKQRYT